MTSRPEQETTIAVRQLEGTDSRYCTIDGPIYVIDDPSELRQLEPRLRKLVPKRLSDLACAFPTSILSLAEQVKSPALSTWLRQAAKSRASITVYDPLTGTGAMPKAFLEFDFGLRPSRGGLSRWLVLVDGEVGVAPHCPPALAEVYRGLGGIQTQYGASGYLIDPRTVRSLAKMGGEVDHLLAPNLCARTRPRGLMGRVDPKIWYAYFAADGDYLCYRRRDGRSRWFGLEHAVGPQPLVSTRSCVEKLFHALIAKERFVCD